MSVFLVIGGFLSRVVGVVSVLGVVVIFIWVIVFVF